MNDAPDLFDRDLRDRLHRLAESAVPDHQAPTMDTPRALEVTAAPRRPMRERALAAAALIVLVGVVGALIAVRGTDDVTDSPSDTTLTSEWELLAPSPLSPRERVTSVWTDEGWFIWGGEFQENSNEARDGSLTDVTEGAFQDGAMFDPVANSWRAVAPAPIDAVVDAAGVWVDGEVVVFAGPDRTEVAAYDPVADSWRRLADAPAPVIAALTGDPADPLAVFRDVVVAVVDLPGEDGPALAGFQPEPNLWSDPAPTRLPANATSPVMGRSSIYFAAGDEVFRVSHVGGIAEPIELPEGAADSHAPLRIAWNGRELAIVAGHNEADGSGRHITLARHDPLTGATRVAAPLDAQIHRDGIGLDEAFVYFDHRVDERTPIFDYATGGWGFLPAAPIHLRLLWGPARAWTGDRLLVWGGRTPTNVDGGEETPGRSTDVGAMIRIGDPTPPASENAWYEIAPAPIGEREGHIGLWTGDEMFVWGGRRVDGGAVTEGLDQGVRVEYDAADVLHRGQSDGALYDPTTDTWRAIPDAPFAGHYRHRGAWTGSDVLVVGRQQSESVDAARFDPTSTRWVSAATPDIEADVTLMLGTNDGVLLFAGALADDTATAEIHHYDASADEWTPIVEMPGVARITQAVVVGDEIWAVGDLRRDGRLVPALVRGHEDGSWSWSAHGEIPPIEREGRSVELLSWIATDGADVVTVVGEWGTDITTSWYDADGDGTPIENGNGVASRTEGGPRLLPISVHLRANDAPLVIAPAGDLIVVGGRDESARRDVDGGWTSLDERPQPTWNGHSAVWTGEEIIVFGGRLAENGAGSTNVGAAYRPN